MKCPKCGSVAENGAAVCACGVAAIRAAVEEQGTAMPEPPRRDPEEVMLFYLLQKRARACARRWNQEHPECPIVMEWAEEAVAAFCAAKVRWGTQAALDAEERMGEFTSQLPIEYVERLFEGESLP